MSQSGKTALQDCNNNFKTCLRLWALHSTRKAHGIMPAQNKLIILKPMNKTKRSIFYTVLMLFISLNTLLYTGDLFGSQLVGDFDGDNDVDRSDFVLFEDVFGTTFSSADWNPVFDLDDDGEISLSDFLIFVHNFGKSVEKNVSVKTENQRTILSFPDYTLAVQYGEPVGIVSLKLTDQQTDFVHRNLPLGDWEWFKIDLNGRQKWLKLIMPEWSSPVLKTSGDPVVLRFVRENSIAPGISLGVEYNLNRDRPEFDIHYSISNSSGETLRRPYVMIGFPGFSNYEQVSSVETALETRVTASPYTNFRDEAIAVNRAEYLLLRHNVSPRSGSLEVLKGVVSIKEASRIFTLESSFVPDKTYSQVYSAHVNKPAYLTCHIYAFLTDIPNGEERRITIHYTVYKKEP